MENFTGGNKDDVMRRVIVIDMSTPNEREDEEKHENRKFK